MILKSKRELLLLVLTGFFLTNAIVAELISNKLIDIPLHFNFLGSQWGPFTVIVGIIPWPVVFLTTDIINEYFGKSVIKKLSYLTCGMIAYAFIIVSIAISIKANTSITSSTATDAEFTKVFGQSRWVIVGSIVAFFVSQLIDVYVFWLIRNKTGERWIWLRTTGSTLVSQLIDSYIVLWIGFYLPDQSGQFTLENFMSIGFTNYSFKLIIALFLTPLIYIPHYAIDRYLGEKTSHQLIEKSAEESLISKEEK